MSVGLLLAVHAGPKRIHFILSFRDGPKDQTSDAQLRIGESGDSGFDASHRPGMTEASFVARVPPTAVVLSSRTMTVESAAHSQVIAHALAPRGVIRPRFCLTFALLQNRGRGCAQCTRWCALSSKSMHTSTHIGGTGNIRHSPRNGLNSFLRALPGDRAFLPPSFRRRSHIAARLGSRDLRET
jgi:hypothetical protein